MDNGNNATITSDVDKTNKEVNTAATLAITVVFIVTPGVFANSLAFYCIIPDVRKKRTIIKLLVLALCIADFCGCIGVLCYHVVNEVDHNSKLLCACVSFMTVYFPLLSGSIATFMATERCVALCAPFWYRSSMHTWRFWAPFACFILFITVVCFFPIAGLGQLVVDRHKGNMTYAKCKLFPDEMPKEAHEATFTLTYGITGLVLVAVSLSCNTAVLVKVYRMIKRVSPLSRQRYTGSEFEITKMLMALSATFLICWVPLNLRLVLVNLGVDNILPLDILSYALLGVNFVVDPLIYILMKRNYREKVKRLIRCKTNSGSANINQLRLPALASNTPNVKQLKLSFRSTCTETASGEPRTISVIV